MSLNPSLPLVLECEPANVDRSRRLLDQHHVAIDALGRSLVLPPIYLSQAGLKILDLGAAGGYPPQYFKE